MAEGGARTSSTRRHKKPSSTPLTIPSPLLAPPGNGGGFFYLSSSGEVLSIPSPSGFEERYVLLDDAAFFEVSGPLGAAQGGEDGGEEVAARFRDVFRKRARMLRIVYTSAVGPRSVEAICRQVSTETQVRLVRLLISSDYYFCRYHGK